MLAPVAGAGARGALPAPAMPRSGHRRRRTFSVRRRAPLSRVYFTGAEGILTEVFYPTLDRVQNVDLQFLVTDAGKSWGDEERRQTQHVVSQINKRAMLWQAETTADSGKWKISKRIFSDPLRNAVIQRVTFQTLEAGKTRQGLQPLCTQQPGDQQFRRRQRQQQSMQRPPG